MKHLIYPAFAVGLSTVGCAGGCHWAGMPPRDVAIATLLAGIMSSAAAFGAVWLAYLRPAASDRNNAARLR